MHLLKTIPFFSIAVLPLPGLEATEWEQARPLLEKYCLECHGGQSVKADLDYTLFMENEDMFRQDVSLLEEMEFMIAENEMPPPTADAFPTAAERKALLNWNLALIDEAAAAIPDDPGVVFMPKLTRDTYNRVLSQLAGYDIDPGNVLSREAPTGMGFTNVGEAHTMEPNQLEKYLMAASEAVSFLRVSPVTGLDWSPRKLNDLSTPTVARNHYLDDLVEWHSQITSRYANEPNQWFKEDGVGHAEYWYQLWRWKYRDALGITSAKLEELAEDSQREINGTILTKWQAFFDQPEIDDPVFEEIRSTWHALPDPSKIKPEEARERLGDLEAWYRRMIDFTNWEPDIELRSDRVFGGLEIKELRQKGVYRYRYDFSKFKDGKSHETLYLTLAKGAKSEGDVHVLLTNGHLLYGDNLSKEPEHRVPWHGLSGVTISDIDGQPLSRSQIVDAEIKKDASILVKTPAILVLQIPEDADGLDLDFVLDAEISPNGTIQHWLDAELPETVPLEFGTEAQAPNAYIYRRGTIEAEGTPRYIGDPGRFWRDMIEFPRYYHIYASFFLHPKEELRTYFEKTNRREGTYEGNDPLTPYRLSIEQFLASLSPEQLAERERMLQELELIAQPPHHDLFKLLTGNDVELLENERPSEAQLAQLSQEDRRKAEELLAEMAEYDHILLKIARSQIRDFAEIAWRRELTPEELDRLMAFYIDSRLKGSPYDTAAKQSVRAILCSPHFIYRYQPARNSEEPYPIAAHGLADRLAAVLWDGIPDEQLLAKARDGSLTDPEVLASEARRMLKDEKADAMGAKFGAEWFQFKNFRDHVDPDPDRFSDYNEEIAYAMEMEATHFFRHMLQNDRPLTDLYQAPYTFVNADLAEFYGINGVSGDEFQMVELPEQRRGGVLTLGSFLTKTSLPLRTSPVVRGAKIIEKVLGEHMPDPPPVPPLSDDETNAAGLTVVEQLAKHRNDPACIGCHQKIDPLGIALEGFDPVGQWRNTLVDGSPVQTSDTTADGYELNGLKDLTAYLDTRRDEIFKKFSRMFTAYALGRDIQPSDRVLIDEMVEAIENNDYRFSAAMEVLVKSKQFRYRRDSLEYASSGPENTTAMKN